MAAYNIATDPGETNDLAELEPERFRTMLRDYERFTEQNNVLPYPKAIAARARSLATASKHDLATRSSRYC